MNFDRMTVHDIGGCGWYMHSAVGVKGERYGWDETGLSPMTILHILIVIHTNVATHFP